MIFELGHKVAGVTPKGDGLAVTIEPAAGGEARTLEADIVLVSIGRRPHTQNIGLETVGVKTDKRGFIETDHFKTSLPGSTRSAIALQGRCLPTRRRRRHRRRPGRRRLVGA